MSTSPNPRPAAQPTTDLAVELDQALEESTDTELMLQSALTGHEDDWSELDPLQRFGVRVAGTLFVGVIILGAFLVPYTLLSNGWTPSP